MSNSLFNLLSSNSIASQFEQFKRQFSGNPKQQVQNMLNSGQMTQQQFNQLSQMANQFQKMIKK